MPEEKQYKTKKIKKIDFRKLIDADIEVEDLSKVQDRLDFPSILWMQIKNINLFLSYGLTQKSIDAIEALEFSLDYYITMHKECKGMLDELNKKYWGAYYKIPQGRRPVMNANMKFEYSKKKYKILMYFLGKQGWLART